MQIEIELNKIHSESNCNIMNLDKTKHYRKVHTMDYSQHTLESRKNKHLNEYERGKIELLHTQGLTPYAIGKILNRASNTIRNELRRGTVPQIRTKKEIIVYISNAG